MYLLNWLIILWSIKENITLPLPFIIFRLAYHVGRDSPLKLLYISALPRFDPHFMFCQILPSVAVSNYFIIVPFRNNQKFLFPFILRIFKILYSAVSLSNKSLNIFCYITINIGKYVAIFLQLLIDIVSFTLIKWYFLNVLLFVGAIYKWWMKTKI